MADDKKPNPEAAAAEAGKPAAHAGTPAGQTPKSPDAAPAQATHTATAAEQAYDTFAGGAPAAVPAMAPKQGGGRQRAAALTDAERARLQPSIDTATLGAAIVAAQNQISRLTSQQVGTPDIDKTVPGGLYIVDGRTVNAHGAAVTDTRDDGKD